MCRYVDTSMIFNLRFQDRSSIKLLYQTEQLSTLQPFFPNKMARIYDSSNRNRVFLNLFNFCNHNFKDQICI